MAEMNELLADVDGKLLLQRRLNLRRLLAPASVAVVGASADPAKAGFQALRSLTNFRGTVSGVHPRQTHVEGVPCFKRVADIPTPPDLAILAIPADLCPAAAQEAADCGVGGILIVSGGFGEVGGEGGVRQRRLADVCHRSALRMLGPNTSGFVNTSVGCVASFVPGVDRLRTGHVAVVAQSGGVNLSVSFLLDRLGVGVSAAVGLGNAVDIDAADVLEWLADDEATRAVALHLEGVPHGRRLATAVQHLVRRKPVVALVAGRSDIGEFAVSHTGNLMGSRDRTVAGLTQAGAVVVESTEDLAQAVAVLQHGRLAPTPAPGFAVITGQAGPGLLIVDALKTAGLRVPPLGNATVAHIGSLLPPLTFIKNPIDTGRPGPGFPDIVEAALQDTAVDAALVFGLHEPAVLDPARVLPGVAGRSRKPVVFGAIGIESDLRDMREALASAALPTVGSPERLALAASALATDARGQWRLGRHVDATAGDPPATALVGPFDEDRAKALLAQYGIGSPRRILCHSRAEAIAAFGAIGGSVVVKIVAADIAHKSEVGGVHLGIADLSALGQAIDTIERIPTRGSVAFLVEEMVPDGVELLLGGVQDPSWGPCVVIGIGGVLAEAMADTAVRLAPLSGDDVEEMLGELRCRRLLDGYRHFPVCNRQAIAKAAVGIGRMLIEHPEIQEIEVNPLRVDASSALALDALLVLRGGGNSSPGDESPT